MNSGQASQELDLAGPQAPDPPRYLLFYLLEVNGVMQVRWLKLKGSRTLKKFHVDTSKKCCEIIANPGDRMADEVVALAKQALERFPPKDTLWNRIKKTIGYAQE